MLITCLGKVTTLESTPHPQSLIKWVALGDRATEEDCSPREIESGEWVIENLLQKDPPEMDPLEYPRMTLYCQGFSSAFLGSLYTQINLEIAMTAHRVNPEYIQDPQTPIGDLCYLPNMNPKLYRQAEEAIATYRTLISEGMSHEVASLCLPGLAMRQYFLVSANLRDWWAYLDNPTTLGWECEQFHRMLNSAILNWVPELQGYFMRKGKWNTES
jgi:hypothetical protein